MLHVVWWSSIDSTLHWWWIKMWKMHPRSLQKNFFVININICNMHKTQYLVITIPIQQLNTSALTMIRSVTRTEYYHPILFSGNCYSWLPRHIMSSCFFNNESRWIIFNLVNVMSFCGIECTSTYVLTQPLPFLVWMCVSAPVLCAYVCVWPLVLNKSA